MRNLLFLYLLFLSASVFAGDDTLNVVLTAEEIAAHPVAANLIMEGAASFETGAMNQALAIYQKALMNLVPGFKKTNPEENPDERNFYANSLLPKLLGGKAKVYETLAKGTGGIDALEKALTCRELVFEADQHLAHVGQVYDAAHNDALVRMAFELYEKTNSPSVLLRVFRLVEKCRKIRSLEDLRDPATNLIANVPGALVAKLQEQKRSLDQQLKNYLTAKGTPNETKAEADYKSIRKVYQNALFDSKKKYPDFYRLQYDESVVTVGEIQNRIGDKDEVVIAFYDTPEQFYVFVVALNGFRARRVQKDFSLESWVKEMRTEIQNYSSGDKNAACAAYRNVAYKLFQKIVAPLGSLPRQLVIIPDGTLSRLPFNALLSEPVTDCNFKNYPFLLRQHQISYHYGTDLYARAAYLEHKSYKNFVGFSSGADLGSINNVMGGKIYDAKGSTKSNFETAGKTASLLHLALPAKSNNAGKTPFEFQLPDGTKFSDKDIYNLKLDAQLAVLSNCELGEGTGRLLDLVEGFQYAGAQSVVTSLWKNDEDAMAKVMGDFYAQLRNGITKDGALRNACLSLWKEKNADYCHPLHWATYMPVGDMDAVKEKSWYLYLIGIAPLVALFYFWRKYRSGSKKK